jgi:hypothetical protein
VEEDIVDCEEKYTPVKTSSRRPISPIPRMKLKSSTPRLADNNHTLGPSWSEYSLNLEIPSEESDDEGILEIYNIFVLCKQSIPQ